MTGKQLCIVQNNNNNEEMTISVPIKRNLIAILISGVLFFGGIRGIIHFFEKLIYRTEDYIMFSCLCLFTLFFIFRFSILTFGEYRISLNIKEINISILLGGFVLSSINVSLREVVEVKILESAISGSITPILKNLKEARNAIFNLNYVGSLLIKTKKKLKMRLYIQHDSDIKTIENKINSYL